MDNLITGVALLLGLLGLQAGMRYFTVLRTKKAWEGAQADLGRGDLESAEKRIARCIKLMPLWLQPRYVLGAVLARQGKLEQAEAELKMAQALQPREPDGFIELGIFYITSANREQDGVEALRAAVTNDPKAWRRLESDPRLEAFRKTPAFAALQREHDGAPHRDG
jgi:predicted Zn-dependent protease